jgi:single-strand DNA-binding protein
MARSLNEVNLIGNLTRDPEMRYTPQGTAVCTIGLATNRSWQTESGEKKEDVEFHRIVAWSKLAEICSQLLAKGRKVYIKGRLQTREWSGDDNVKRTTTEIVASEMILLDSRGGGSSTDDFDIPENDGSQGNTGESVKKEVKPNKKAPVKASEPDDEEIPF